MSEKFFESSDSVRSAAPLKHAQSVTFDEPLQLELGSKLPGVTVMYETYGKLNSRKDNAVLICHALSGDSHVARHDEDDDPGWWDIALGPRKCIDTNKYFVICPNSLGGCRGTTGPNSINPATEKPYGRDFPTITVSDIVETQKRLVDYLGIDKLLAVIGGSMGGHQVLHWGCKISQRVCGLIVIATSPRLSSQALAFDVVARNAILQDKNFHNGQYYEKPIGPGVGLAIARMLGHITYLSPEAMDLKFQSDRNNPRDIPTDFEKEFSVGSYLAYQGEKFVELFDPNSYLTLSMAMDLYDCQKSYENLPDAFRQTQSRWLVMSFSDDWLFPPEQSRQLVDALLASSKSVSYCQVSSNCGHDAFLLEDDLESFGGLISGFLANLDGKRHFESSEASRPQERLDYDLVLELSQVGHSILDLGCGSGELLSLLARRGHKHLLGVELDEKRVISCVNSGLDVIQSDLNEPLDFFADGQFDFVVLSLTLQAIMDVEGVVNGMLRVGNKVIITFPNFGYVKLRKMLHDRGLAPVSEGLLRYEWFNTPNIRFLTIKDFENYCRERDIEIHHRLTIDTERGKTIDDDPNLYADLAIFVISRQ